MARHAKTPGMRDAMAIHQQQIRTVAKFIPCRQQRRVFAKRQKTGNIRHCGSDPRHLKLDELQRLKA